MIAWIGDNIISSLGFTTGENYQAVLAGRSGTRLREYAGLPESFMASLIDRERLESECAGIPAGKESPLEKAAILSATRAATEAGIDLSSPRVQFFFSSTKGNVALLDGLAPGSRREEIYPWHSARIVSRHFGNPNEPVVISNACISGASAQVAALRALEAGRCDHAAVIGAEMLSRFIVSGFQCLKALSPETCRPFDANRTGLNLGEAAATVIYKRASQGDRGIMLARGVTRNDANHISGPSRTGEGCFLALKATLDGIDPGEIAFVNAHGTATPYNDRMEAIALARAGLNNVPVNSLKGYFGHALGAAGVLESIISTRALMEKWVIASKGFETREEEYPLNVTKQGARTGKPYCVKMLSGFGGCNAVLLFKRVDDETGDREI
ncbi:MAG: beta-ketoacyl synthase [Odoribacteraceae bacterium]|jgi:3-oxoacyl-[acyl-carrier-protein] synthase-1|nr:beta-ketoacyl synthase [Odoribacteraceae bacterium]